MSLQQQGSLCVPGARLRPCHGNGGASFNEVFKRWMVRLRYERREARPLHRVRIRAPRPCAQKPSGTEARPELPPLSGRIMEITTIIFPWLIPNHPAV